MTDPSRPVTGYPASNFPQPHITNLPNGHSVVTIGNPDSSYPYVAAPPAQPNYYNQNPNPYYAANPYAAQRRPNFLRRIFVVLITSVILTGTILFVVWLVLRPRIPQFRVDSLTLSNFNISSSSSLISGNWDVQFTVRNPNSKMTLAYDHVEAFVNYKSGSLSKTTVPPFVQDTKSETAVRASFAAVLEYVDKEVVEGINGDKANGRVNFNVRMLARVKFKAGSWRARSRFVRVLCSDLAIGVSGNSVNGSLVGGSRKCKVGL